MARKSQPNNVEVKLRTDRFGEIITRKENIIEFPEGIIGFSTYHQYVIVPHDGSNSLLYWLQSIDEPNLAFPITSPTLFKSDFKLDLSPDDQSKLKINEKTEIQVLTILSIPSGQPQFMTLNLQAPIVMNCNERLAKQIILSGPDYPLQFKVALNALANQA